MVLDTYLRTKLRVLSFLMILLVFLIHAKNGLLIGDSYSIVSLESVVFYIFSDTFARSSVYLFFAISGYLLFLSIKHGLPKEFLNKYISRFRSLVIPYFLWGMSISFLLKLITIIFPTLLYSYLLVTGDYFSFMYDKSLRELFNLTLLYTPFNYQFWFIRDLIILVLISPIIYFLLKLLKVYIIIPMLIIYIFSINTLYLNHQLMLTFSSLLFFSLGGYLAIYRIDINKRLSLNFIKIALFVLFILFIVQTLVKFNYISIIDISILTNFNLLITVAFFWFSYDYYSSKIVSYFDNFTKYTFFIFALHEPILSIVQYILKIFLDSNYLVLIYFLAPFITFIIVYNIAKFFSLKFNAIYLLYSGGR